MSDSQNRDDEVCTAGWDAITDKLKRIYPEQEPRHWGTILSMRIGGKDPLDGISAYVHEMDGGSSHWHFVTFGMSELYDKEEKDKEISGWGFEFTFRLKRQSTKSEPPPWPLNLLQNLARYVFKSGNVFAPGHHLPLNGPIALGTETAIHAAMFAEDSELGSIDSPNGKIQFLQLVGITMEELSAVRAWNSENFLALMRETNPLLVTDLARQTIMRDGAIALAVEKGTLRDGSSTGWLAMRELETLEGAQVADKKTITIVLGASGISGFQSMLRGRIPFGRDFALVASNERVVFSASETFDWKKIVAEKKTTIALPPEAANKLATALRPLRGDYAVPSCLGLIVRVVPSKIMDPTGKNVVEVIG